MNKNLSAVILRNDGTKMYLGNATPTMSLLHRSASILYEKNIDGYVCVELGAEYEETENDYVLKIYELGIEKITNEEKDTFQTKNTDIVTYSFNKDTLEGSVSPENIELSEELMCKSCNYDCIIDTSLYIEEVLKNNAFLHDYFYKQTSFRIGQRAEIRFFNLLKLLTLNLIEVEKLISSGNENIFIHLIHQKDCSLEKGKKLNQVLSLPKFAIDFIKEHSLEGYSNSIKKVCEDFDGNTAKIIIEMMDNLSTIYKNKKYSNFRYNEASCIGNFFNYTYDLLQQGYKISPLLNYLLKQRVYYSGAVLGIPFEELKELRDYLDVCSQYDLKTVKYPQDAFKAHNIAVRNIESIGNEEDDKMFKNAVKDYCKEPIEYKEFTFIPPVSIKALIQEGNDLNHCVGSYVDKVKAGQSRIYFMRKNGELNKSYVTVELDVNNNLIEYKENFNKDVADADTISAVKKFVKDIQKGGK